MSDTVKTGPLSPEIREMQGMGIVLFDHEGRLCHANAAFATLLGYELEDCAGLRLTDLLEPDGAAWIAGLQAHEDDYFQAKCRARRRNGSHLQVLLAISILRGPGIVYSLHMTMRACTIALADEAHIVLSETEHRWRAALEAADQGVWDHNNFSGEKYHSPTWRHMRGLSEDDPLPITLESWLAGVHPDDHAHVTEYVRRQDQGLLDRIAYEFRERHKDGHWIWILSRGQIVERQPDGMPIRIIGTDTDITSLKNAEAQLAAEKERLKVTLQSIGDGVISTDAVGRVSFMNPVAEQMTGWSFAKAEGLPVETIFRVVESGSGKSSTNPVVQCLADRQTYEPAVDLVLIAQEGQRHDIRSSAAPLRARTGETLGAVLVFQDISDSRALQRQLAHAASHDSLTGLPNRAAFEVALAAARAQEGRTHALCFMDIDRFKAVNDSAGHAAGDALLKQIAQITRRACRQRDFAARIGGDEFVLLLSDCSPEDAARIAKSLVEAISTTPFVWNGKLYRVGASIGITSVCGDSKSTAASMSEADAACYAAKANGRGGVELHRVAKGAQKTA